MVKITDTRQKYMISGITKDTIDVKLKEVLDGIKDEMIHKKYSDAVITVNIRTMSVKEMMEISVVVKEGGRDKIGRP